MQFNLKRFYGFCHYLSIDTKEQGRISLAHANMKGTQLAFYNEVAKGLSEDIHHFIVLKCRQAMITTAMEAIDLYWLFKYPGLQGTLVGDSDGNTNKCRSDITLFMKSLPNKWRVGVTTHNRNILELGNQSRLFYQTAGTRGSKFLGQSKGINFCHSTETGSYGSGEGVMSLEASFAADHPNRLYVFESTAHGFNYFEEMWQMAKRAKAQRAVFIGWWLNEQYQLPVGSPLFDAYWDGKINGEEGEWVEDVYKLYGHRITPPQIAWWRFMAAEKFPDMDIQQQNYPCTEYYAFIKTGNLFFSTASLTDAMRLAKQSPGENYRFTFGATFADTKMVQATERMAQLTIWEMPCAEGVYAVGADPAYGSSDYADRFAIQVFRCYADGLDQVAEFASSSVESYQYAWIIAVLCGMYRHSRLNLEMNSCGGAVYNELKNLKRQIQSMSAGEEKAALFDAVGHMRYYMWQQDDTISGASNTIGWMTNARNKDSMLSSFKDLFELKRFTARSVELLNEMGSVQREDGEIKAEGRGKDDRVMAAGLAVACYVKKILPRLYSQKLTRAEAKRRIEVGINPPAQALQKNVDNYLARIGLNFQGPPQ